MALISTLSGLAFEQAPGQSILDAATSRGIAMPYSCRTGRCSSCKARVVSGQSSPLVDELGLSSAEQQEGWVLTCARTAQTDLLLEVDDLGSTVLPPVQTVPCRISALERLAPDVMQVRLRLPPTTAFSWLAGQYIDVIGPGALRRSYSVANAHQGVQNLELHIRAVETGAMSRYWFSQAKVNDLLRLNGPVGTFFLRDCSGLDLVFLATGTGIAPIKAMLEDLVHQKQQDKPRTVTVYWGARTEPDLYNVSLPNVPAIRFVPVLSRATAPWAGACGHVQQAYMADSPQLHNAVVYACGSDAMIQSAKQALLQAGLPSKRFYADAFVSSGETP
jgi:CDP-4-dehydro-6-deoxyglucose reductase